MTPIAFKTQFGFEPAPAAVAVDAIATPYTTPNTWQETLDDLARLTYLKAKFRYDIRQNQASATGAGTLKLMAGTTVVASIAIDFTTGQRESGSVDVDLSAVAGASDLSVVLDVTTAAAAGTTAQVFSRLDVTFPMAVLGC